MKVLICGDRHWTDRHIICDMMSFFDISNTVIIHGGARGADTIAGDCAKELGIETIVYPADWNKYGRAAGPIRNKKMLGENPDYIVAFHDNIELSKGTKHMASIGRDAGIPVSVITTANPISRLNNGG